MSFGEFVLAIVVFMIAWAITKKPRVYLWSIVSAKIFPVPSQMQTFKVKVDRSQTPQQLLEFLHNSILSLPLPAKWPDWLITSPEGWAQNWIETNLPILSTMPLRQAEEVEVVFFRPEIKITSATRLAAEYWRRGLIPDPQAHIAAFQQYPKLHAKGDSSESVWSSGRRRWASLSLGRQYYQVYCTGDAVCLWFPDQWFAGVRKK